MTSTPKKHHFVPQMMLRRFTEPGTNHVHVFDLARRIQYRAHIKTTAAQERYYDVPPGVLEEFLAYVRDQGTVALPDGLTPETLAMTYEPGLSRIEGEAAPVIASIVSSGSLRTMSAADRAAVSVFLAVQAVRTPAARRAAQQVDVMLRSSISNRAAAQGHDPESVLAAMGANAPRATSYDFTAMSLLEIAPNLAPLFSSKRWALLRTTGAAQFVLGDNPITRMSHRSADRNQVRGSLGLGSIGVELALPLSPRLCLVMLCPTVADELPEAAVQVARLRRLHITPPWTGWMGDRIETLARAIASGDAADVRSEWVDELNARQVDEAEQRVMSASSDFTFIPPLLDDIQAAPAR